MTGPNVAIIGCGAIGTKRAVSLPGARLVACADTSEERAKGFARQYELPHWSKDWRAVVERPDVDLCIVAVTHDWLAPITLHAVSAGKHVLVEKPAARHSAELLPVIEAAERANVCVRVGFNHRYHRAFRKAREIVDTGALGPLLYVRGRYGHGGRPGYDREWRADPAVSGGGELIDQGVHLIDLARWFLGDFRNVLGYAHTYYWNAAVEDNGFLLLRTALNQVALLHASWTEWKNLFSFELFGRDGKLEVNGLGGSYGTERLTHYRMFPEMGPPETTTWEYPMADDSWKAEFAAFAADIRERIRPSPSVTDAYEALKIVEHVYKASRS